MLSGITDHEIASELYEGIADVEVKCCLLYDKFRSRSCESKLDYIHDMLDTADSASQMAKHFSVTSSRVSAQQIELECQRAELRAMCDLEKEQAKARAKAAAAEAEARFRVAQARLDAEEKLLSMSQKGSTVTGASRKSRRSYHGLTDAKHARGKLHYGALTVDTDKKLHGSGGSLALGARVVKSPPRLSGSTHVDRSTGDKLPESHQVAPVSSLLRAEGIHPKTEVRSHDGRVNIRQDFLTAGGSRPDPRYNSHREGVLKRAASARGPTRSGATCNQENVFNTYLERQSRNEYIKLAPQIGFDGTNIAFVFYENQIRELMAESPCRERRLEILRASSSGQARETINLFLAPMKSIST